MIKIVDAKKNYAMGENSVTALGGLSLTISDGEFVSVVGASGSGKSTLMNIIGCLDTLSSGSYFLDGTEISSVGKTDLSYIRGKKIGFIFQNFNLIPTLTAEENIELPLIYGRVKKSERKRLVSEALKLVGLSERAAHKPYQLSGGQQQRVAVARAVAAKPPIILADEPCGNLDSASGSGIMTILSDLHKAGCTVVLITHDEKAAKTAERIIRISDGKIIS